MPRLLRHPHHSRIARVEAFRRTFHPPTGSIGRGACRRPCVNDRRGQRRFLLSALPSRRHPSSANWRAPIPTHSFTFPTEFRGESTSAYRIRPNPVIMVLRISVAATDWWRAACSLHVLLLPSLTTRSTESTSSCPAELRRQKIGKPTPDHAERPIAERSRVNVCKIERIASPPRDSISMKSS